MTESKPKPMDSFPPNRTVAFSSPAREKLPEGSGQRDATLDNRYDFTSVHAAGGMGRVWKARDCQLDREVAIKELRPENVANAKTAARFIREARLTGQLQHPGVVPVYELTTRPGSD